MHITSTSDAGQKKISKARSIPPSRGTLDFRIGLISETELELKKKKKILTEAIQQVSNMTMKKAVHHQDP